MEEIKVLCHKPGSRPWKKNLEGTQNINKLKGIYYQKEYKLKLNTGMRCENQ